MSGSQAAPIIGTGLGAIGGSIIPGAGTAIGATVGGMAGSGAGAILGNQENAAMQGAQSQAQLNNQIQQMQSQRNNEMMQKGALSDQLMQTGKQYMPQEGGALSNLY